MKQGQLHAIAHNLADSIASGCSLLLDVYGFSIGAQLAKSPTGRIVIDCLHPRLIEGELTNDMRELIAAIPYGLTRLCEDEHGTRDDFSELHLVFSANHLAMEVEIIVGGNGRAATSRLFTGRPLKRKRVLDKSGRLRRTR
jgi:hypothetical protein